MSTPRMRVDCVDVCIDHEDLVKWAKSSGLLPDPVVGRGWTVSDIQDINGAAMIQFRVTEGEELTIPALDSGAYGDIETDKDILRALEEQGRATRRLVALLSCDKGVTSPEGPRATLREGSEG